MSDNNSEGNPPEEGSASQPQLAIGYAPADAPVPSRPPRQPHNLQDLLRFAVEAGSGASGNVVPQPMNEANRGFLLNALNSMMVNVTEELASILKTLKDNHDDKEAAVEALDNLSDYVCSIDYANDFLKMGGLPVLELLLAGPHEELRWRAAETIADIVQNNPYAQTLVVRSSTFPLLLSYVEADSTVVRVKCLYAVSCLVRENETCLREFMSHDGGSILLRCLQSQQEKLVIKACFLIGSLCTDSVTAKGFLSIGIVDQICSLINIEEPDTEVNEHLCSVLSSLTRESSQAVELCRHAQLNLKEKLNALKEYHGTREEYHKELEYVNAILKDVFEPSSAGDEYEDR